jgi:ribonuclease HI
MSTGALTCQRCGASFSVPDSVRERYPGWTPRLCRPCHTDARTSSDVRPPSDARTPPDARGPSETRPAADAASRPAAGQGAPGRGPKGGGRRNGPLVEENLTTREVLERYHDGPRTGVFTDGSSIPNPGPGGWGAVYVVDDEVIAQDHGHEPDTTNNRMEFTAIIRGAALVPEGVAATVHTDSRYCHDAITKWAAGWEKRGWRRKTGEVKNLDLVQAAFEIFRRRHELEMAWVPAHSGYRWNEYADSLSTAWLRDEV